MAKLVTRTKEVAIVKVLCMDLGTETPFVKEVTVPAQKDEAKLFAVVSEMVNENEGFKAVSIKEYTVETRLYGMDESFFFSHAKVLPPRSISNTVDK